MRKRVLLISLFIVALCFLASTSAQAADIQVRYQVDNKLSFNFIDNSERSVVHYVYGSGSGSAAIIRFDAEIVNANDLRASFDAIDIVLLRAGYNSQEVARFSAVLGTGSGSVSLTARELKDDANLPLPVGRYDIEYWGYRSSDKEGTLEKLYPAAAVSGTGTSAVPQTPSLLTIHYKPAFSGSSANLKPKLNDTNLEFYGYIQNRSGNTREYNPRIDVIGGNISSWNCNDGYFSVKIAQVTAAGAGALALTFDDTIVYAWDVEPGPFPALQINPGVFRAEEDQTIYITPFVNDFSYADTYNLLQLDSNRFSVELSGVPIYSNSLNRYNFEQSEYTNPNTISGMETRKKVVFDTGYDLSLNNLRFSGSGTLKITIYSEDGNYRSSVDLPVERGSNNEGLIGAPSYMSYAGENELNLRFALPSGRPVREYSGTITIPGQDTLDIGRSSETSYFYELEPVTFNLMGRGTISVRVNTTDSDYDSRSWTREFTYSRPTISLSTSLINLDDEVSLTVVVRDASGNPVNNGTVYIEGVGSRTSSGNGEYRFSSYKWSTPGYKRVQAFGADGTLLADFSKLLYIKPQELLTLEIDSDTVMAGAEHTIRGTVTDEQGRELTGARIIGYVDDSTTPVYSVWNSSTRDYSIRVTAQNKAVLHAESSDGRRVSAEIEVTAAQPEVKSNLSILTANYMERLELSFFSPSGQPLSGTVTLRGQNLQISERSPSATQANGTTTSGKNGVSVAVDLYCRPLTASTTPMLLVDFTFGGRLYREILTIPIGEAKISVSPTKLMSGVSTDLTLEIKGASGQGIPGVPVEFMGSSTSSSGTTNSEGKVSFRVVPASTVTEYVLEVTRTDQYVQTGNKATKEQVTVPVDKDTTPPTINISNLGANNYISVEDSSFTFNVTISDEVGLDVLYINTASYPLSGTSDSVVETVNLSLGDNDFAFVARDKAGNSSTRRDVTVRYSLPASTTPPPTAQNQLPIILIIDSDVVMQGTQRMPAPPLKPTTINGRTMLPFRYLVQTILGGTVDYVEATQAITAYIGGHIVEMIVGSPVIYVDGVQVILDQPPVEFEGTTLVPVRAFEQIITDLAWDPIGFVVTIYP